ncbi:hypothetical protein HanIR_Chr17g0878011 [Helianthus annuus]|nr:hypothetical protein HanIR_Chr17g0878011 [Helianthus annuus]
MKMVVKSSLEWSLSFQHLNLPLITFLHLWELLEWLEEQEKVKVIFVCVWPKV